MNPSDFLASVAYKDAFIRGYMSFNAFSLQNSIPLHEFLQEIYTIILLFEKLNYYYDSNVIAALLYLLSLGCTARLLKYVSMTDCSTDFPTVCTKQCKVVTHLDVQSRILEWD